MESWSYVSGGKGFMTNDVMSTSDSFARRRMPCWSGDSKAPSSFGNGILVSGISPIDNQGLGLMGYQDFVGKQLHESSMGDVMSSRVHGGKMISPYTRLEDESSPRLSSSIVDSDGKEPPSLFDLQLGVFGDPRDSQNSRVSGGGPPVASSSESYMPPRRARMGVNCHAAYCQVYGCNKDLSSSKDYHKRHKVCEAHSKTAKVIVNGIEQRFCQQCSRFHLLAEFDDGKRSCRKRLAGHNQRRRKPQVGFHTGRTGRLLQAYNAGPCSGYDNGRFHGTALSPTSFVCSDLLPSGLMHPEKYKPNDWSTRVKLEQGANCSHLSAVSMSNGNLPSRLLFPSSNGTGSIFAENSSRYLHNLGAPDANSRSLIADSSLGNNDFPAFSAATTIQGISGITDSGCALSLLSSQSNNSSSHSSGMNIARPMIAPGRNSHYSMTHVSEKLIGVSSLTSSSGLPNRFSSQVTTSAEGSHLSPILIPESNVAINFDIAYGIYQAPHFVNQKDQFCCEAGDTINLLQLSSQLHRVECEKHSMQVKQETNSFCCPHTT